MKKITIVLLIIIGVFASCFGQSGAWGLPESYISRNNIQAIVYLNSDSAQIARILFTKEGLVKEHAKFVRYKSGQDSILQVHAYEYDSTNKVTAHSYFQYTIGTNEFPLVTNALHNPDYKKDSIKISRYASAYGHFYSFSEYFKKNDYWLYLNDTISFHGSDTLFRGVFESDSIVFRDDAGFWCFKYRNSELSGYWYYAIVNDLPQLYLRIWFNELGLPEKESVYKKGKAKYYTIVVKKWN